MRDPPQWFLEGTAKDVDADLLALFHFELVERFGTVQQGHTASGDDPFLDRRLRGVHGILDPCLLLLHLGFGGRADLDDRHAAHQFREPLLQLLAVVVRGRLLDLRADLFDATFDGLRGALTFDDRGGVLIDRHLLGRAEVLHADVLKFEPEILGDGLAVGQDGEIFKHRLAPVTEPSPILLNLTVSMISLPDGVTRDTGE